jgi:hypothetical protein
MENLQYLLQRYTFANTLIWYMISATERQVLFSNELSSKLKTKSVIDSTQGLLPYRNKM